MGKLMEVVVERENMRQAYSRVMRNKGAAGVDEMSVADLKAHLQVHWSQIKEELLAGRYEPLAVRSVSIPKPNGKGERLLGIPTVTDRLIQQALHQVLSPIFDAGFSDSSFGFRPGRHARQAVQQARQYVSEGRRWVVDLDLEKFFDRVMASISRFLECRLKLPVNTAKSVVARPWQRTFLGYSMMSHRRPRVKVPPEIVARLRAKLKVIFRRGRGRSLSRVIAELTPILRGWMNYFRDIEVRGVLEVLDGWLRRRLRTHIVEIILYAIDDFESGARGNVHCKNDKDAGADRYTRKQAGCSGAH